MSVTCRGGQRASRRLGVVVDLTEHLAGDAERVQAADDAVHQLQGSPGLLFHSGQPRLGAHGRADIGHQGAGPHLGLERPAPLAARRVVPAADLRALAVRGHAAVAIAGAADGTEKHRFQCYPSCTGL